jgi:hypothetical protein
LKLWVLGDDVFAGTDFERPTQFVRSEEAKWIKRGEQVDPLVHVKSHSQNTLKPSWKLAVHHKTLTKEDRPLAPGASAIRDRAQRGTGLPPYRSKSIAGFNSATIALPASSCSRRQRSIHAINSSEARKSD